MPVSLWLKQRLSELPGNHCSAGNTCCSVGVMAMAETCSHLFRIRSVKYTFQNFAPPWRSQGCVHWSSDFSNVRHRLLERGFLRAELGFPGGPWSCIDLLVGSEKCWQDAQGRLLLWGISVRQLGAEERLLKSSGGKIDCSVWAQRDFRSRQKCQSSLLGMYKINITRLVSSETWGGLDPRIIPFVMYHGTHPLPSVLPL